MLHMPWNDWQRTSRAWQNGCAHAGSTIHREWTRNRKECESQENRDSSLQFNENVTRKKSVGKLRQTMLSERDSDSDEETGMRLKSMTGIASSHRGSWKKSISSQWSSQTVRRPSLVTPRARSRTPPRKEDKDGHSTSADEQGSKKNISARRAR